MLMISATGAGMQIKQYAYLMILPPVSRLQLMYVSQLIILMVRLDIII